MKHKRNRTLRRAALREGDKRLEKARCEAADLRAAHGMCLHGDEEKVYFSQEERDADKTPNVICEVCARPRLRVAVLRDEPLPEFGELVIKDLLKREDRNG